MGLYITVIGEAGHTASHDVLYRLPWPAAVQLRASGNPSCCCLYSVLLNVPSKLLTSTVTPNFDRRLQIFKKIVGASWFKIGRLSQKLFSLKYFL
jgi:hypothetical protein